MSKLNKNFALSAVAIATAVSMANPADAQISRPDGGATPDGNCGTSGCETGGGDTNIANTNTNTNNNSVDVNNNVTAQGGQGGQGGHSNATAGAVSGSSVGNVSASNGGQSNSQSITYKQSPTAHAPNIISSSNGCMMEGKLSFALNNGVKAVSMGTALPLGLHQKCADHETAKEYLKAGIIHPNQVAGAKLQAIAVGINMEHSKVVKKVAGHVFGQPGCATTDFSDYYNGVCAGRSAPAEVRKTTQANNSHRHLK